MKLTFEELLKETEQSINKALYKYRYLKTEREELKQELLIHIWQVQEKGYLEKLENIKQVRAYIYRCCCNNLVDILIKEHKQGLWVTSSISKNDDFELTSLAKYTDNTLNCFYDRFLENYEKHLKEYRKQYYQKNKEYIQEYNKQYYQEHKEYALQYAKQYYQEHKEYTLQYAKQYREEHKEEIAAVKKSWAEKNKEHRQEYMKELYQKNRQKRIEYQREYRKRKKLEKEKENENNSKHLTR